MKIEIDDEFASEIVIKKLKETRKTLISSTFKEMDYPHLIHAAETLIRYFGRIDEDFE